MIFEHNGGKITVREDPLTGDVIKSKRYFNTMIGSVLGSGLTEEERNMEADALINRLISSNPEKFGEYSTGIEYAEQFETILLATSLTTNDINALPDSVRIQLFEKCKEALQGTARDFFGRSGKSSDSSPTLTMKELSGPGTSSQEGART